LREPRARRLRHDAKTKSEPDLPVSPQGVGWALGALTTQREEGPVVRSFGSALVALAAISISPWSGPAFAAAASDVDVELVLTVDVSRPMDQDEAVVARGGYVAAFHDPDVISAIKNGGLGRIAVTYVEFAQPGYQTVVIPWTIIDSQQSAYAFADLLNRAPLQYQGATSISDDLMFAAGLFDKSGYNSFRLTIDVSGNGPNNSGMPVTQARDTVTGRGIVINGLPIDLGPREAVISNLTDYYKQCVIGGVGAFMESVSQTGELPAAIRRKLIEEIADRGAAPLPGEPQVILTQAQVGPPTDCQIGEKLNGSFFLPPSPGR
jgi:hypothetical protein